MRTLSSSFVVRILVALVVYASAVRADVQEHMTPLLLDLRTRPLPLWARMGGYILSTNCG